MIDSLTLNNVYDAANTTYVPRDFAKRLFIETARRFEERSTRILFTRAVRNEEIVVPLPESLISEEDITFVAYIAPERKTLESHMRQSWASNVPICERVRLDDTDEGVTDADMAEAYAEAVKQELVAFDPIIGKLVEDGEIAVVLQYDLDYLLATPAPADVMTQEEWTALSEKEQYDWTPIRYSKGRIEYRRYKSMYWRDRDGRSIADRYYRDVQDDGMRRSFTRDPLQTRRAWKAHAKSIADGKIPIKVRLIPALDVAPLLVRGTGNRRWECRGMAIKSRFEESDLIAQGLWWNGARGLMIQEGFGTDERNGRQVDLYEAHVYLTDDDGQPVPCIVYCVDNQPTWCSDQNGDLTPAVINLKEEYGLTELPANYFWGTHTEDDSPDMYGFPVIYPLAATILNREGTRTAFQAHLRKYAFSKMAMIPDPKMPAGSYTNADGSLKDIDMDKEIIPLPGPVSPLTPPPPPTAVIAIDSMYSQDLQANGPNDPSMGANSNASGHSLTVQRAYFNSANSHVLEGARECTQWIVQTALSMIGALESKYGTRTSVYPVDEVPTAGQSRKKKGTIEFNPRWFQENYRIKLTYPKVGNLAETQQLASLYERGLASFDRVMESQGVQSVMEERIKIMQDKFWASPVGMQTLFIEVLRRRGSLQQAAMLQAQLDKEMQPEGLPSAAIPPEIAALAAQMGQGGQGAAGGPTLGASPGMPGQQVADMPGVGVPDQASSSLGGIVAAGIGGRSVMNDSIATQAAGAPG